MMDGGMMGMMGLWMLLVVLVFIALVVGGVYLLVRAIRGDGAEGHGDARGRTASRSDALAILEERYARGEIDAEDFEERRRTLRA